MVQAFPKVQNVAFMVDESWSGTQELCLSQGALVAMTFWRHARVIDLRGVCHVDESSVQAM